MAKRSLPPGFRFHPTDVELIKYYLKRKVMGKKIHFEAIAEVDIYKYAPWDLPDKCCWKSGDLKWYFFCPREKKYANGGRMNRATDFGYWKTTGKDRPVHYNNEVVGMIKTLVFHIGKAPRGDRTDWVMHEYRIEEKGLADQGVVQDAYVLSVVFQKEGPGPRNGAQYGAPFKEEDWDGDMDVDCIEGLSSAVFSTPALNQTIPLASSSHVVQSQCVGASDSCLSDAIPSAKEDDYPVSVKNDDNEEIPVNMDTNNEVTQGLGADDILSMLNCFTEYGSSVPEESVQNEMPDTSLNYNAEALDGIDIFNDLGDLGNLSGLSGDGYELPNGDCSGYNMNQNFPYDDVSYLELIDLDAPLNCPAEVGATGTVQSVGLSPVQNCYDTNHPDLLANPSLTQTLPVPMDDPYRDEDQWITGLKEKSICENVSGEFLDNDDAAFSQFCAERSHFSDNPGGGGGFHDAW